MQSSVVNGYTVKLDILIKDVAKKLYNVEVQRSDFGASPRRVRYHSSMLDARMLLGRQEYDELEDSFVIFITENDYFKENKSIYVIDRYIEGTEKVFSDGSHIIYVNRAYKGEDKLGWMLENFRCKNDEDAYYPEFAKCLRYFKKEEKRSKKGVDLLFAYML